MNKSIDFLREKKEELKKKAKEAFLIRAVSGGIVLVFLLFLAGLFYYSLILKRESEKINRELKAVSQRIEKQKGIETKQVYLKNKLLSLKGIISERRHYQQVMIGVLSLIPPSVKIDGFSVEEKEKVRFRAETSFLSDLLNFLEKIEKTSFLAEDIKIKKATVEGVSFDQREKKYLLGVILILDYQEK